MSLLITKVGVPPVFPSHSRPITMARVGEFRRMIDRHQRNLQEASGNRPASAYISKMQGDFKLVKVRIGNRIDLIG